LYQSLDFLQPAPQATAQQAACVRLKKKLERLGSRPVPKQDAVPGIEQILAALKQLGLAFTAEFPLDSYRAVALLQSQQQVVSSIVLIFGSSDYILNQQGRYGSPP